MKTAMVLLAGIGAMSLAGCGSSPAPCPDFAGFTASDATVMCGDNVLENLGNGIAWRDLPEEGSCSDAACDAIEVVTNKDCEKLVVGAIALDSSGGGLSLSSEKLTGVKAGVPYKVTLHSDLAVVRPNTNAFTCS